MKRTYLLALILALYSIPWANAQTDSWSIKVKIDCYGNEGKPTHSGSSNWIKVEAFFRDGRSAGSKRTRITDCSEGLLGFEKYAETVEIDLKGLLASRSKLRLTIDGDNAFWLDQLEVNFYNPNGGWFKKYNFGVNGKKGWCLSTDPDDWRGGWEKYIDQSIGCTKSWTFTL